MGWAVWWRVVNPAGPDYVTRCPHRHRSAAAAAICSDGLIAETSGWVLLGVHPDVGVAAVGAGGAGAATVAVVVAGGSDPGWGGGGVPRPGEADPALTTLGY